MVFDPWEALRVAVRVANLQSIGPTKGAIVQLQGRLANLDDSPAQGVIPAYVAYCVVPGSSMFSGGPSSRRVLALGLGAARAVPTHSDRCLSVARRAPGRRLSLSGIGPADNIPIARR